MCIVATSLLINIRLQTYMNTKFTLLTLLCITIKGLTPSKMTNKEWRYEKILQSSLFCTCLARLGVLTSGLVLFQVGRISIRGRFSGRLVLNLTSSTGMWMYKKSYIPVSCPLLPGLSAPCEACYHQLFGKHHCPTNYQQHSTIVTRTGNDLCSGVDFSGSSLVVFKSLAVIV